MFPQELRSNYGGSEWRLSIIHNYAFLISGKDTSVLLIVKIEGQEMEGFGEVFVESFGDCEGDEGEEELSGEGNAVFVRECSVGGLEYYCVYVVVEGEEEDTVFRWRKRVEDMSEGMVCDWFYQDENVQMLKGGGSYVVEDGDFAIMAAQDRINVYSADFRILYPTTTIAQMSTQFNVLKHNEYYSVIAIHDKTNNAKVHLYILLKGGEPRLVNSGFIVDSSETEESFGAMLFVDTESEGDPNNDVILYSPVIDGANIGLNSYTLCGFESRFIASSSESCETGYYSQGFQHSECQTCSDMEVKLLFFKLVKMHYRMIMNI